MPAVCNLGLSAERGFFEFEGDIYAKIRSALRPSSSPAAAPTKDVAETEELPKDIVEILKDGAIEACTRSAAAQSRMAKAVIHSALLRVREHGICFARFFEFLFSVGIVGIAVRMVLQRQLTIGALDLLVGRPTLHSQYLVVISLHFTCQNSLLCSLISGLDFSPHAPSPDAADGLSVCIRAVALPARDDLRRPWSQPFRPPRDIAGQTVRPAPISRAPRPSPVHPAMVFGLV